MRYSSLKRTRHENILAYATVFFILFINMTILFRLSPECGEEAEEAGGRGRHPRLLWPRHERGHHRLAGWASALQHYNVKRSSSLARIAKSAIISIERISSEPRQKASRKSLQNHALPHLYVLQFTLWLILQIVTSHTWVLLALIEFFSSIICVKVNFLLNSYSEQILPKKLFSFEMFLP